MSGVKLKLHKAFTLAELMVILAVMTVVIAAVAPILTSRHNTLMSAEVWNEVSADDDGDIHTAGSNPALLQEIMIGVSPLDLEDIKTNYKPYAKLVIRSSDRVNGNIVQRPIEFYHNGQRQGFLAAGRDNLLLGGEYNSISYAGATETESRANTAYGKNALNGLTTGSGNTAIGSKALQNVSTGNFNTGVGAYAGQNTTAGSANVYIGYNTNANGSYNTVISDSTNVNANYSTAVGERVSFAGDYNTAIGYSANASGSYNTAVGAFTRSSANSNANKTYSGSNNTAIGYMSCAKLGTGASNKTCIGQAVAGTTAVSNNDTQVFIGRGISSLNSPAAVVVNNARGTLAEGLGDAAVVVYGNLIVRGQTYMYGKTPLVSGGSKDALMGYTFYKEFPGNHKPYIGFDGSAGAVPLTGQGGYLHQVYGGRENCICTQTGSSTYIYLLNGGAGAYTSPGKQSYDWTSDFGYPNRFDNIEGDTSYFYTGNSGALSVDLSRAHAVYNYGGDVSGSCCPILTQTGLRGFMSDARLKNIGGKFDSGLKDLSELKIYDYYFKADKLKEKHVGVIAQDLKMIFPNAVTKNSDGYYKIRWDEMFYSAINSIKELNQKITSHIERLQNDLDRIAKLKKENKKLENQLIELAAEIHKLEQKK